MTSKFIDEQREKAFELLTHNGDLDIMSLEDFMTAYEPYEIAEMVRLAGLKLDCNYIRVNTYYADTQEADSMDDLISDDEVEEALQELQQNVSCETTLKQLLTKVFYAVMMVSR